MISIRILLYLSTLATLIFGIHTSKLNKTAVTVSQNSSLVLKGSSNVNNFSCHFNMQELKNPIPINYYLASNTIAFEKATLVLHSDAFDCGGKMINKDFQKTLKADAHPQIFLSLKEIKRTNNPDIVNAQVAIEIADITRNYQLPLHLSGTHEWHVTGDLKINLNDFDLETPKKLFGMISVHDIIEIDFNLHLKV
ncbi:hypothetical protein ACFSQP_04060 [Bizionia sediminis]|uniref:YceI family protein n=1 Tax=Bizionia sediminis TaxID=1737064 RepID=A0ABW5KRM3_9FLAO